MTTEEKAKAYDEALERAKQKHGKFSEFVTKTIEEIFPQLRESEDERIRKAIRLVLIATEDEQKDFYSTHGLTRKDCTNWLEKQKEQKPAEWSEEDEMYLSQAIETLEHETYFILADKLKSIRPQPKQEWNEYDNEMFHCICAGLCHLRKLYEKNEDTVSDYNAMIEWFRNRFKSLRPSWKPSKEQMEELMGGLRILPAGETYHILLSLYNDLKKL